GAQQVGDRGRRRADEDEVGGAVGDLVLGSEGALAEHLATVAIGEEDLPFVAVAQDVVRGDEAELARMARCAGDDDAARVEEGAVAGQDRARVGHVAPVTWVAHASRTSIRASTAIGTPPEL